MKNSWIIKGDKVIVLSGNDLGKVGTVLSRTEDRILIQGVNVRKRHLKTRDQNRKSEIVSIEKPIHISNIALCDSNGKKLKLKQKKENDGSKSLVHLEDGKEVVYRVLRKPLK